MEKWIEKLKENFCQKSLPGEAAQEQMSPGNRKLFSKKNSNRPAAVILLIFPLKNKPHIAFIKRNTYDGPHSGQISFPGGMKEKEDPDLAVTALRECEEEIGVPAKDIRLIGKLSSLQIPVSNTFVQPYVGVLNYNPEFKKDPVEVDHIILIPLSHFTNPQSKDSEYRKFQGEDFSIPFFRFNQEKIWGATAMILNEFLEFME